MNPKRLSQLITGMLVTIVVTVNAGLGMAPAGAAEGIDKISFDAASFDLEADTDTKGDKFSAEVEVGGDGIPRLTFTMKVRSLT